MESLIARGHSIIYDERMAEKSIFEKTKELLQMLGPGIITGASDDDPSGIATYSQAGAAFGTQLLWTSIFASPFMIAIQEMCARIGLVTGRGITGVLRKHYHKSLLYPLAVLTVAANTLNIAADINAMASATHLLIPVPPWLLSILFSALIVTFMILMPYRILAKYLKWLTLALFCYIVLPFVVHVPWGEVALHSFIPTMQWTKDSAMILVAILGTTISPYLFFWQASLEVEQKRSLAAHILERWIVTKKEILDMRKDVVFGMLFCCIAMWFIMLTTGITLNRNGILNIRTAQDAAEALRPIAGEYAYVLFTLGIIGTGLLAIPVLAGSSSYVLSEAFGWEFGFNKSFKKAWKFYAVTICSALVGVVMTIAGVDPIKALLYTAVVYGVISPIIIGIILHICNNPKIMGEHKNNWISNLFGWLTFILMIAASLLFFWFSLR